MLKLINDTTGTYSLTIEYQEKEFNYTARKITDEIGEELWFIWATRHGKKVILRVIYNRTKKELREDLMPGQPASIPVEFLQVIEKSFQQK
jgi:hypothetical protein